MVFNPFFSGSRSDYVRRKDDQDPPVLLCIRNRGPAHHCNRVGPFSSLLFQNRSFFRSGNKNRRSGKDQRSEYCTYYSETLFFPDSMSAYAGITIHKMHAYGFSNTGSSGHQSNHRTNILSDRLCVDYYKGCILSSYVMPA